MKIVQTKEINMSIEHLFDLQTKLYGCTNEEKEITECNVLVKNLNGFENPKHIIRHKTNKGKWCLKTINDHVITTDDHSIIISRNGNLIVVSPLHINKEIDNVIINDREEPITYCEKIGNFDDEYVYDISMQNNKTFYANNILVHNTDSVYLSLEDVVADLKMRNLLPEKYKNDIPLFCYDIVELGLNDYINQAYDTYAKKFNTKNIQKFELENILYNVIFLAKKKYVGDLAWKEGSGFVEPNKKLKITGIEIIQSSTPKFCRTHLQEMLNYIFKHTDDFKMSDFILMLNDIKRKFKIQPIEDISFSKSLGDYEKFILEDKKEFKIAEKCPIHVRGGGYHNYLLNSSEEFKNKYKKIKTGDKIKFYHAKDGLCNVFSFLAGDYPYEIAPEIDFDLQFEKTIIDPINRILDPLGVGKISSTLISSRSLF